MSIIEVVEKFVKMWYNTFACERQIGIYRDAVKSESCVVVHTVQLNYDLGGEIE